MTSHDSSRTADPLVGRTLGDCTIQDCLARARRCAVYQARQRPMNREVAVKVLSPALSSDPAAVERFVHEGEAAAAAWDDALVEVHSVGESDGLHYIVMGLVDGEELSSQLLRDGPLRAARAVPLMMQIGAALAAVHRAGVIHCDLQPANILVTDDGKAKLGGFSQAKFAGAPPPVRREDDPTDLPLYFPPEAARGKPLDVRSDIYLFGATLYHLLSGFPPFEAASPEALALMHLREPAPPLQREAPGTPPELCDLVHKLLQKDPAERPETVQDVLDALDRIELDTAGQVKAAGLFRKRKLRPPRRKRLIAGLAVAILGVTLLGLATGVFRPEPPQPPDPLATALDAPPPGPTPGPVEPPSPWQPPTPTHPPWEAALADTGRAVAQLVGSQAFGRALAQYDALEAEHPEPELRVRTGSMREAVLTQAQTAYAALEARATALEATGDFDEARALLRHVVDHYGLDGLTTAATERLAALGRVEKATRDQWAEERRAAAERDERLRLERLSALRKEALHGMRQSLRALDIAAARKHVAGLAPGDATLEQALQDIARVAAVKRKLIALVNAPQPRLRTASIGLPGMGGELKKADDRGLEVHRAHGRPETYSWEQLGAAPLLKLAQRATDAKSGEDLLTCGLLASLLGLTNKSGGLFKAATRLGADATPYLTPLVRDDLAAVERLVGEGQFELAAARLKQLEATHRGAPWLAAVRDRVDGARGAVERGMGDAKAEKVYREAVALFEQKRFFELKPFVTRLKDEFPSSQAVTDTKRPVPFARLAQAVDGLGIRLTVGRRFSDVRTLAEAIEQAKPHSLIELTDTTPYMEAVTIPAR
ncbi:serine/threonine protein kinase, partial [bacterium]|nr:serine/threonine protein kinase [bacterium]